MYTSQQVSNSLAGGAALPYTSANRAFTLSMPEGGCLSDVSETQSLYGGKRIFDNIRLAQGAGGEGGQVLQNGVATFVNPSLLEGAIQGRSQKLETSDAYRDDSKLGLVPFKLMGGSAGGIKPELYVGTISEGLSTPEKTELLNQRSFLRSDFPNFNLFPESEADAARKQNACRLNTIQKNYIQSRLNAASSGSW
jgi:hypothetical protein